MWSAYSMCGREVGAAGEEGGTRKVREVIGEGVGGGGGEHKDSNMYG